MAYKWIHFVLAVVFGIFCGEKVFANSYHYPMVQVSDSPTRADINVLVPRLKQFELWAVPKDNQSNPQNAIQGQLYAQPASAARDLLHERVLKFRLEGLTPNQEYEIQLKMLGFGNNVTLVDRRLMKTMPLRSAVRPVKFMLGSCMSDEAVFAETRQKIWASVATENPDFIVHIGDLVYVDSFDFVRRGSATELDIWQRYFENFKVHDIYRLERLIPFFAVWDDHDTGIDNGNAKTASIHWARHAFATLFGEADVFQQKTMPQSDASTTVETSVTVPKGLQRTVTIHDQLHFVLFDNRSYRTETDHLGNEQIQWGYNFIRNTNGFHWLASGDMWGSETIFIRNPDGSIKKRLTEGYFGDHPSEYFRFMSQIQSTGRLHGFLSGDIHFSQIIAHDPQWKNTPRYSPFSTVEITSSPLYSIIFPSGPGEPAFWTDHQRLAAHRDYNYVLIQHKPISHDQSDITITSKDRDGTKLFQYGTRIIDIAESSAPARRRFLVSKQDIPQKDGKVKIAFFDADGTLRLAPSGAPSANRPEDVYLLPNVAEEMHKLKEQGYFIAIVSNQGGVSARNVAFLGPSGEKTTDYQTKFDIAQAALFHTRDLILADAKTKNIDLQIHYIDFAERDREDVFTKPQIGMAQWLQQQLNAMGLTVDWQNSFMVGDATYTKDQINPHTGLMGHAHSDSDRLFAQNLGIAIKDPGSFFHWSQQEWDAILAQDVAALRHLSGNNLKDGTATAESEAGCDGALRHER